MRGAVFAMVGGVLMLGLGLSYAVNVRGVAARHARWELGRRARRGKVSELPFVHVRVIFRMAGGLVALFGFAALVAAVVALFAEP